MTVARTSLRRWRVRVSTISSCHRPRRLLLRVEDNVIEHGPAVVKKISRLEFRVIWNRLCGPHARTVVEDEEAHRVCPVALHKAVGERIDEDWHGKTSRSDKSARGVEPLGEPRRLR